MKISYWLWDEPDFHFVYIINDTNQKGWCLPLSTRPSVRQLRPRRLISSRASLTAMPQAKMICKGQANQKLRAAQYKKTVNQMLAEHEGELEL